MTTARIAVAAGAMGLVTWVVTRSIGSPTGSGAIVRLASGVVIGVVVYGGLLLLLRVEEIEWVRDRLRRRRSIEAPDRSP